MKNKEFPNLILVTSECYQTNISEDAFMFFPNQFTYVFIFNFYATIANESPLAKLI